jgi:hypothetical protein
MRRRCALRDWASGSDLPPMASTEEARERLRAAARLNSKCCQNSLRYPYAHNDPLYIGPSGASSGGHDRNAPGDDLAGWGKSDSGATVELPFELACQISRLPRSRPFAPNGPKDSRGRSVTKAL